MSQAAARRPKSRDLSPLAGLWPHVRAHIGDAIGGGLFLIVSSSATVGLSAAGRYVVDHGLQLGTPQALNQAFGALSVVVALLAAATALRFYFVSRLGERVVADLRRQVYDHILTLDPAFFTQTRTGEVLSRMTTDMTIIETVSAYASIALRNLLMFIGSLGMLIAFVPRYTIFVLVLVLFVLAPCSCSAAACASCP